MRCANGCSVNFSKGNGWKTAIYWDNSLISVFTCDKKCADHLNFKITTRPHSTVADVRARVSSLAKFSQLVKERWEGGYMWGQKMEACVVLGRYYLDENGNAMMITVPFEESPRAEPLSYFNEKYPDARMMAVMMWVPSEKDVCPGCGHGWTLDNLVDVARRRLGHNPGENEFWHIECRKLRVEEDARTQLLVDLSPNLYPTALTIHPNKYCSESGYGSCVECGPWFEFTTKWVHGSFHRRLRNSVVEIEWPRELPSYHLESFEKESWFTLQENKHSAHVECSYEAAFWKQLNGILGKVFKEMNTFRPIEPGRPYRELSKGEYVIDWGKNYDPDGDFDVSVRTIYPHGYERWGVTRYACEGITTPEHFRQCPTLTLEELLAQFTKEEEALVWKKINEGVPQKEALWQMAQGKSKRKS